MFIRAVASRRRLYRGDAMTAFPESRYTHSADGTNLAYQVSG